MEKKTIDSQFPSVAYVRWITRLLLFRMFELVISMLINLEKSDIPQKKALLLIERSFKTGWIFITEGPRQTLVKMVPFLVKRAGPSRFKTSFKQWIIGLSFEVYNSFLPQFAEMASCWSSKSKNAPFSCICIGLQTSKARHF